MTDATTTTPAAPRTTQQKLDTALALVAKLQAQLTAEKIENDIKAGDAVTFVFGRADGKKTLAGTVAGFAETAQGKIVAITVTDEQGLPDIKRVNIKALLTNTTADARRAAEATVEPAVSNAVMDATGAVVEGEFGEAIDPLNVE